MAANQNTKRLWETDSSLLPQLDLTLVQRESYQWFLETGIKDLLTEVSPISDFTGKNWELSFGDYFFGRPRLTPAVALEKGLTFDMPLKVMATLVNKQTGHRVVQEVFLGDIPAMTQNGTFIINGIERCVVNQLVRSPGIYYTGTVDTATGKTLYSAEIRPMHGSWLEFITTRNDVLMVRIDRRRKFVATTFLRAIGLSTNEEIINTFKDVATGEHNFIEATLAKDPTHSQTEAVLELYRKLRPGEPIVLDNAQELLTTMFFDYRRYSLERVGRYKMNKKLSLTVPNSKEKWILTRDDIIGALKYLIGLSQGKGDIDDIDHLGNRRVRRVGELVATNAFRVGLLRLERSVREKMSLAGPAAEDLTPMQLVNARPIIASINDFFRRIVVLGSVTELWADNHAVAAMLWFREEDMIMTYNSGYSESLAGFYLKARHMLQAAERGIKKYNFLQGNERYKYELGGKDFLVYRADILL